MALGSESLALKFGRELTMGPGIAQPGVRYMGCLPAHETAVCRFPFCLCAGSPHLHGPHTLVSLLKMRVPGMGFWSPPYTISPEDLDLVAIAGRLAAAPEAFRQASAGDCHGKVLPTDKRIAVKMVVSFAGLTRSWGIPPDSLASAQYLAMCATGLRVLSLPAGPARRLRRPGPRLLRLADAPRRSPAAGAGTASFHMLRYVM